MRPKLALTTSVERVESLRPAVEAAGLRPVALPCIEVSPAEPPVLEKARQTAEECDWLVLTSPRTVTSLWPCGGIPDVPVAAVGPSTAAAVEAAGGEARVIGAAGASDLFETLRGLVDGGFIYYPHGGSADVSSLRLLAATASRVEAAPVYETSPVAPVHDQVDAVIFGSPSAISGWFLSRDVDGVVVGAIGPTTATALERRGIEGTVVPEQPSFEQLVTLISARLRDRSVV